MATEGEVTVLQTLQKLLINAWGRAQKHLFALRDAECCAPVYQILQFGQGQRFVVEALHRGGFWPGETLRPRRDGHACRAWLARRDLRRW